MTREAARGKGPVHDGIRPVEAGADIRLHRTSNPHDIVLGQTRIAQGEAQQLEGGLRLTGERLEFAAQAVAPDREG